MEKHHQRREVFQAKTQVPELKAEKVDSLIPVWIENSGGIKNTQQEKIINTERKIKKKKKKKKKSYKVGLGFLT